MTKRIFLIICLALIPVSGWSATLYMGSGETYTNLQAAMAAMSAGDTLIIRDGTYTGATNTINDSHLPPSGNSGVDGIDNTADDVYTTIRAENHGSVLFDGEGIQPAMVSVLSTGTQKYIAFDGIGWCRSNDEILWFWNYASYFKITNCFFFDSGINGLNSSSALYIAHSNYILIEDCQSYGESGYGMIVRDSHNCILRRCVIRKDAARSVRTSGISIYSCDGVEIQNCIIIDSDQTSYYTNITDSPYAIWLIDTNGPNTNIYVRGCIVLGWWRGAFYVEDDASTTGAIYDSVFYDGGYGVWDRSNNFTIQNTIVGSMSESGWSGFSSMYSVVNSMSFGITGYGIKTDTTHDYCLFYNNSLGNFYSDTSAATHDFCSQNSNEINPLTSGLLYLTRIEDASTLKTGGESGGRIGPTILHEIGAAGTYYGDIGYNTTTETNLWPYPNEDVIKTKMTDYAWDDGSGGEPEVTGDRGFASSTAKQLDGVSDVTLTSYIWEYLGNQMPADIYGTGTTRYYLDADGDGYSPGDYQDAESDPGETWYTAGELTATSGDCNDSNAAINPGATEICGNGVDDDCDGADRACATVKGCFTKGGYSG